jgi:GH18 family chitinase
MKKSNLVKRKDSDSWKYVMRTLNMLKTVLNGLANMDDESKKRAAKQSLGKWSISNFFLSDLSNALRKDFHSSFSIACAILDECSLFYPCRIATKS